jgi:MFS family permease
MLMLDIARRQHRSLAHRRRPRHGPQRLQWVVDAYTLALASVVLTAGSLADRFGRRRLFTIGLAVFTAASAACAARPTSSSSTSRAPCRASAPRSCSPSRSPAAPIAYPT